MDETSHTVTIGGTYVPPTTDYIQQFKDAFDKAEEARKACPYCQPVATCPCCGRPYHNQWVPPPSNYPPPPYVYCGTRGAPGLYKSLN